MALAINVERTSGRTCVQVSGEVDVSCADELRSALAEALEDDPADIEVSLAEVPYIDSTGIGVLVGAAHRSSEGGTAFSVTGTQRNVRRVLGMLGLERDLGIDDGQREAE